MVWNLAEEHLCPSLALSAWRLALSARRLVLRRTSENDRKRSRYNAFCGSIGFVRRTRTYVDSCLYVSKRTNFRGQSLEGSL